MHPPTAASPQLYTVHEPPALTAHMLADRRDSQGARPMCFHVGSRHAQVAERFIVNENVVIDTFLELLSPSPGGAALGQRARWRRRRAAARGGRGGGRGGGAGVGSVEARARRQRKRVASVARVESEGGVALHTHHNHMRDENKCK